MSGLTTEFIDLRDVHPFVKWAGGKGQLLSELDKLIPSQFNRYFEPFLGGAAMFIHLASKNVISTAYLCDTNEELIKSKNVISTAYLCDTNEELIKAFKVEIVLMN